jgi:Fic family protein
MTYIWQQNSWPDFTWDADELLRVVGEARFYQGAFLNKIKNLGFELRQTARTDILIEEVVKTSAIEGEIIDPESVRSSAGRKLGLPEAGLQTIKDRKIDGLVAALLDATMNYKIELSAERICGWHGALFPTGYSGLAKISVGQWRKDKENPMRVVSGPMGREIIHFEAPPAEILDKQMQDFLFWLNTDQKIDGLLKAGLAHLWFITLHPFDDGNGRIARALTDMLLASDEDNPKRFYSLSSQIMAERKDYYEILNATQAGTHDVTSWLKWFLECMTRAIHGSEKLLDQTMAKSRFWDYFAQTMFNERQTKALNRLLDAGINGFEGGLKNKKYMGMTRTSRATAQRELADLVDKGALIKLPGGGRSVSYDLDWDRWTTKGN